MKEKIKNIGFISTRIAGTDGVSLEISKWAKVLEKNNYMCYYFAGECDRSKNQSFIVKKAHFEHPEIKDINKKCFGIRQHTAETTKQIHKLKDYFKQKIYKFVNDFKIDLIIPENVLCLPMNLPLGMAISEFIAETKIPTIAHHHDFYWERDRFLVNSVNNFLQGAFPPDLPLIKHVVINSLASEQLSHRRGISNIIIPNVYDFAFPPSLKDQYYMELRKEIGLKKDDLFILQPTRVVPRKWIERSIELVHKMGLKNPVLVISHSIGDEGDGYYQYIKEHADNLGVKIIFIDDMVGHQRMKTPKGKQIYSIEDVYRCADLVTYPSGYEGFGNAFLEAIYYKRPIVVNRYSIYIVDIEPKGFDMIAINGLVTKETIKEVKEVISNEKHRRKMVEHNYQLALKYFSYELLEKSLLHIIHELQHKR